MGCWVWLPCLRRPLKCRWLGPTLRLEPDQTSPPQISRQFPCTSAARHTVPANKEPTIPMRVARRNGMELNLCNDETCPSGHISRLTHFLGIVCHSFVIFNYVVNWNLWLMGFNVCNLTSMDSSYQVKQSNPSDVQWSALWNQHIQRGKSGNLLRWTRHWLCHIRVVCVLLIVCCHSGGRLLGVHGRQYGPWWLGDINWGGNTSTEQLLED